MEAISRYQILDELGRGAMGIVFRALDPAINRTVAIKTIKLAEFSDPAERGRLRDRLFREAQSAGQLSHPGIVTIYDVGEQDDITYIAMEFVNGPTLEKMLMAEEPPTAQTVVNVLQQTGAALDYAHKKGIVHRDIKPANIMIDGDGTVKITDFGVAKIAASQQLTQMTHPGTVLGTPNYMSPEQIQGKPVDGKADQFSLGVVAYEMLTGERPFSAETLTTVLYKIVSEEPPAPQHLNPTLGWPVAMVIGRGLAKDPAKRYPTCTEFVTALDNALKSKKGWKPLPRGASQSAPTAIVGAGRLGASTTESALAVRKRRNLVWHILAGSIAALGLAGLLFVAAQRWMFTERQEQATEATAPPPVAPPVPKPSPMGEPPAKASQPAAQPETPTTTTPAPPPTSESPADEQQAVQPPAPAPPKQAPPAPAPKEPAAEALDVVTAPPGATVMLDNDPSKTCQSRCTFSVPEGRHTLAFTMQGYRPELRILEIRGEPKEIFVELKRAGGTVRIESEPAGAQIYVNGQLQKQTTPATLSLPVGKYTLMVEKSGRRVEQPIEVHDGSILRSQFELPQ